MQPGCTGGDRKLSQSPESVPANPGWSGHCTGAGDGENTESPRQTNTWSFHFTNTHSLHFTNTKSLHFTNTEVLWPLSIEDFSKIKLTTVKVFSEIYSYIYY